MKLIVTKGTTSKTMLIFIHDSSVTTGAGLTGLAFGSSGLSWYYYREGAGTGATQVTLATQTIGTWSTGGFIELDATDMPGWYEIGVPNAVLASGADFAGMQLKGATDMAPVNIEIQLTDFDVNDGVRGGMTALPNAVADAAGGLPISDAGGLDLDTQLDAAISSRATPAQVNTEVLDVLNTDTITLPGQTAPPLAPTHRQALGWLYKVLRNRTTQTATQWSLLADDESTVDAKATVSDAAGTATKQEIVTGP